MVVCQQQFSVYYIMWLISINSKGESAPFPFYFSEYERLGIELIEPLTGLIETKTGEGNVEIRWGEEELEITSNLRLLGEEYNLKQSTHVDYIHKGAIISCRTPNPGLYLLTIYGRRIVDEIGKAIISFQVLSTMEGGQYVREYGVFEGKLISPLHSQLKLGLQYEFKVRSLHAISIQLIFPQNNIKLIKGENNIWYLKAALTHQQFKDTETTINMKFPDKGNLCYTLCKYKITE